jgi:hypothetical protein
METSLPPVGNVSKTRMFTMHAAVCRRPDAIAYGCITFDSFQRLKVAIERHAFNVCEWKGNVGDFLKRVVHKL